MFSLLLAIIYVAFIGLGLPDSLLGSAWPVMQAELSAPMSFAGVISMIITVGTILSSLLSDRMTKKLGAGVVTAGSVALTAVALFGFSVSPNAWMLCVWAIPYGIGAGGVDAALNNYVALHYSSRHMSWLHCFWGVGASVSPYIMSFCLSKGLGWQSGYFSVSVIQIVITALLFFSLPLWKNRVEPPVGGEDNTRKSVGLGGALKIPGVKPTLLAFLCYCAMETTAGLWATTYLSSTRGIDPEVAAQFASFFYLGITGGRLCNGFVADRLGDKRAIRVGVCGIFAGIVLLLLPINTLALAGLIVVGFGCAPVYPSIIHATPVRFGAENSQAIVGIQMASAYVGSALMPPLFGLLAELLTPALYPFYLLLFAGVMLILTERVNLCMKRKGI